MLGTVDRSSQRGVTRRQVLDLPRPLDRRPHELVQENRLAVNADGTAAAFFEKGEDGTYDLRHTDARVAFRSNRAPRVLEVECDRALIWGKAEGEPAGIRLVEPGGVRLIGRLDRVRGVRRIGPRPSLESVAAYGCNVDDPPELTRFVSLAGVLEIPSQSSLPSSSGDIIMRRDDGWVRTSLAKPHRWERLPFPVADVDVVMLVHSHGEPVYVLRRHHRWLLWRDGDSFELPHAVRKAWGSPTQNAFALLTEAPPAQYELFRPPLRTLVVTGANSSELRAKVRGRFDIDDVRWSPDGTQLAACVQRFSYDPDADFEPDLNLPPVSSIVTTVGPGVIATGAETLREPVLASNGTLAAYVTASSLVRRVVAGDHLSRDVYAWHPHVLPGGIVGYYAIDHEGITHVTL